MKLYLQELNIIEQSLVIFVQLNNKHCYGILLKLINYKMIAHQNHIIDGDLEEAACIKRPLKEAPVTEAIASARSLNHANVKDLQSPARKMQQDVDSPARVSNECYCML